MNHNKLGICEFSELKARDIFEDENLIFIKTERGDAVNLISGKSANYSEDCIVNPLRIEKIVLGEGKLE